ncbi:glycosyltransferase [Salinisphaera sp. T31B1]|uniref:glycosyltransferase n=1 Tax=Salinisphaera sp. T31B1 TaxID=727963 RepID=UPI003341B8AA
MDNRPEVSVVIPFCNEQDNVAPVCAAVDHALGGVARYELVAIDDGSTDDTAGALASVALEFGVLRILKLAQNRGQSTALANGIHAARAPLIVTLDGDGQNPPADMVRLLDHYRSEALDGRAAVVGWRRQRDDSWLRRLSSRCANSVRARVLGDRCPDTGCGLKVFRREDFLALPRFQHMHRFLPALFVREGVRVISVPVAHLPRRSGQSKYGVHNRLWVGLVDMLCVYWLMQRRCPVAYEAIDV